MEVGPLAFSAGGRTLPVQSMGMEESPSRAERWLVLASILLLAFNDLTTLLSVGELSQDAFIYIVPILGIYLLSSPSRVVIPKPILYFAAAFGGVTLISIFSNYQEILAAYFKGRSGTSRIYTQSMMLVLGIVIAIIFYNFTLRGMTRTIVKGCRIAILVMAGVGLLEVGSWYSVPGLTQAYEAISLVIHSHSGLQYPERLRMTAFEVSWAGVMLTFFFPFAVVNIGDRRWVAPSIALLVGILVVLAQSRTALLVFGFQVLLLTWFHFRHRVDYAFHAAAIVALGLVILAGDGKTYDSTVQKLSNMIEYGSADPEERGSEENVSNVTRLASINAALSMFRERPLFGVGFGQYGFHYPQHISADDLRSWEVRDYINPGEEGAWPPSYSFHARMLAEVGASGYAVWMCLILLFLARSLKSSVTADPGTGQIYLAVAMILSGWLLLGMSIDSFRFFGGWITLGVALGTRDSATS